MYHSCTGYTLIRLRPLYLYQCFQRGNAQGREIDSSKPHKVMAHGVMVLLAWLSAATALGLQVTTIDEDSHMTYL